MSTSTILIEELSTDGAALRSLALGGGGLPEIGAEWGTDNILKTTWYPGNPDEGTQQFLVSSELPTSWTGRWSATLLTRTPANYIGSDQVIGFGRGGTITSGSHDVTDPHELREIVDDLARSGHRLRVSWTIVDDANDTANGLIALSSKFEQARIVREGRVKHFKYKPTMSTDIEWEIEWEWQSRGAKKVRPAIANRDDAGIKAASDLLQSAIDRLNSANVTSLVRSLKSTIPNSASFFTLGKLEAMVQQPLKDFDAFLGNIRTVQQDFVRAADIASQFASLPLSLTNAALRFARNSVALANAFIHTGDRTSFELYTIKSQGDDLGTMYKAWRYSTETRDLARGVAAAGAEAAVRLGPILRELGGTGAMNPIERRDRRNDILSIHRTVTGDTPNRLSSKYYGNPDHAVDILRANRLPWYQPTFDAGIILVIPRLITSKRS